MFRSLRHRNARLFFGGLLVSNIGTWMQATVQIVVVLKLATHDTGTWLGRRLALEHHFVKRSRLVARN